MRKLIGAGVVSALLAAGGNTHADSSAAQGVTFEVRAIDEISFSGDPSSLTVNSASAGSEPAAATDDTTTLNITTNGSGKTVSASLDSAMPANTTLKVTLGAPSGAASVGEVTLSTDSQSLLTGIDPVAEGGVSIHYEFAAQSQAGVVAASSRTVTYTITDGS